MTKSNKRCIKAWCRKEGKKGDWSMAIKNQITKKTSVEKRKPNTIIRLKNAKSCGKFGMILL